MKALVALALASSPLVAQTPIDATRVPGDMFITGCSLGCSSGQGGAAVFCSQVNVFVNGAIGVSFSEAVDPASLNAQSFSIINVANGTAVQGTRFVDPLDATRVVFQPLFSFDSLANPILGFEPNAAYQITIPGTAQGDLGPFISNFAAKSNQSRLSCTILTDQGILDVVPGTPSLTTLVDTLDSAGGVVPDQPAPGAAEVDPETSIEFLFHDLMNPATLALPQTGLAPFITVELDGDGNPQTAADRVPILGSFTLAADDVAFETELVFDPTMPLPAGAVIVVRVPEQVTDLTGNPVTPRSGGGQIVFRVAN